MAAVRLTDFWERMETVFGPAYARSWAHDVVLPVLGLTVDEAIDSGIDTRIPQLAANLWVNKDEIPGNGIDDDRNGYVDDVNGWDFRDEDASSLTGTPIHWHGTFTASIIAAPIPVDDLFVPTYG